jgi:hypothetical protein
VASGGTGGRRVMTEGAGWGWLGGRSSRILETSDSLGGCSGVSGGRQRAA